MITGGLRGRSPNEVANKGVNDRMSVGAFSLCLLIILVSGILLPSGSKIPLLAINEIDHFFGQYCCHINTLESLQTSHFLSDFYLQEFFIIWETYKVIVTRIAAAFVLWMVTRVKTLLIVITWAKWGIIVERIVQEYVAAKRIIFLSFIHNYGARFV